MLNNFQSIGDFMLRKDGFLLIEAIMGLFILGIIVVTCLPLISTSIENIKVVKIKSELIYIAESTIEKILSFSQNYEKDEYIMDIKISKLMKILSMNDSAIIDLPQHDENNWPYKLKVYKDTINHKLWAIKIEISSIKEEKRIEKVVFQSIIPIER